MAKRQRAGSRRSLRSGRAKLSPVILDQLVAGTPSDPSRMRSPKAVRRRRRRTGAVPSKYTPRWYSPGSGPAETDKVFLSRTEVRELIFGQLATKLAKHYSFYFADERYFCPPLENAREIIDRSHIDKRVWVEEILDCDDFALMLKAHFVEAGYKHGLRRSPHCFGIAWGKVDQELHALNWMVNADRQLRFVEPQTDGVFNPRPEDHDIHFIFG